MPATRFIPIEDSEEPGFFISRKLPENICENDIKYFDLHLNVILNDFKTIPLNNVILFKDGVVFKNRFVNESKLFHLSNIDAIYYIKKIVLGVINLQFTFLTKNTYVIVFNRWSNNYFHWFTEVIPRVIEVNKSQPNFTFFFPFELNQQYQIPSLEILGVKFRTQKIEFGFISKIVLSSPFANYSGQYLPKYITQLKSKYKLRCTEHLSVHKLVYIKRSIAKRSIVNAQEVELLFKSYGFFVVSFDNLSFDEQISYLANTEVLASIHGAALTNMIFMPKGKKVIEILKENETLDKCYFNLSSLLNLQYWYLFSKSITTDSSYVNADLIVDIDKLNNLLKKAITA